MTTHGRLLTIGVLVLSCSATIATRGAERDPWARVPAFPTACYWEGDPFNENLAAAQEALSTDISNQNEINDELKNEVNSIDPMELASRQQQYMMDHPQEAMALMQRNQQLGQDVSDIQAKIGANKNALDEELEELDAQYKAALDKAFDPLRAKAEDLDARAQKDLVLLGEIGYGYAPWAVKEWNALVAQGNAAYQRVCAEWWAAPGPYHAWLARYREHLVNDQIPTSEEADSLAAGFMVQAGHAGAALQVDGDARGGRGVHEASRRDVFEAHRTTLRAAVRRGHGPNSLVSPGSRPAGLFASG